jgi:hypothetical protein
MNYNFFFSKNQIPNINEIKHYNEIKSEFKKIQFINFKSFISNKVPLNELIIINKDKKEETKEFTKSFNLSFERKNSKNKSSKSFTKVIKTENLNDIYLSQN